MSKAPIAGEPTGQLIPIPHTLASGAPVLLGVDEANQVWIHSWKRGLWTAYMSADVAKERGLPYNDEAIEMAKKRREEFSQRHTLVVSRENLNIEDDSRGNRPGANRGRHVPAHRE